MNEFVLVDEENKGTSQHNDTLSSIREDIFIIRETLLRIEYDTHNNIEEIKYKLQKTRDDIYNNLECIKKDKYDIQEDISQVAKDIHDRITRVHESIKLIESIKVRDTTKVSFTMRMLKCFPRLREKLRT